MIGSIDIFDTATNNNNPTGGGANFIDVYAPQ
jgi:hypothetical protein